MVTTPGVANFSGSGRGGGSVSAGRREVAVSVLAANRHLGQAATRSSPASVRTMNSWEPEPPIAPEWAWTATKSRPQRLKIRS
jgi:hypothetical protein